MIASVTAGPARHDRVVVVGLGAAVVFGALAQGGYYRPQAITLLLLVGVAAVGRAATRGRPVPRTARVAALCWAAFALWALGAAAVTGDLSAAVPAAAVAAGLAAAVVAVAGLPAGARRVLAGVVLTAGAAVALTAWGGVALHLEPLAVASAGLWRGNSMITYANATAAFLLVTLVAAVVRPLRHRIAADGLAALLLLGLLTTASRAGALALLVAGAVFVVLTGRPGAASLRRAGTVLAAVAFAFAGLVPGLSTGAPARPVVALAGLVAGAAVLALAPHVRGRVVAALCALVLVVVLPAAGPLREAAADRLTTASAERADLTRVTAEQFWSAPLTGVGRVDLRYTDHAGERVRAVHTHDEYLQTAAETGLPGLALVLAGAAALVAGALRTRTREGAAAAAVLAAFAVHSAVDFLWHVPVLPLLLVLTVVPLINPNPDNPSNPDGRRTRENEPEAGPRSRPDPGARRCAGRIGRGRLRPARCGQPAGE